MMLERAFSGFASCPLPAHAGRGFGVKPDAQAHEIEWAFRRKAKEIHPDPSAAVGHWGAKP
jgi:hypothetical protein